MQWGFCNATLFVPICGAVKELHIKESLSDDLFSITILNEKSRQNWIEFALKMTVDTFCNRGCSAVEVLELLFNSNDFGRVLLVKSFMFGKLGVHAKHGRFYQ